jgi:hypothetical protein
VNFLLAGREVTLLLLPKLLVFGGHTLSNFRDVGLEIVFACLANSWQSLTGLVMQRR